MFNALRYTKKLEEVGLSREQAEAHVQMMMETMEANLATKQDVKDMATKQDLKDLRFELESKMDRLENKLIQTEYRLTIKLGTIVSIAIGVAVTLAKMV